METATAPDIAIVSLTSLDRQTVEAELSLPLPSSYEKYDDKTKINVINYLSHLDFIERKAYQIGIEHLGSSFNILKSNGYVDWSNK